MKKTCHLQEIDNQALKPFCLEPESFGNMMHMSIEFQVIIVIETGCQFFTLIAKESSQHRFKVSPKFLFWQQFNFWNLLCPMHWTMQ